ncbi:MAG TPA: SBBP repeat-containing protein [Terriglobia bacterium]|nr:SBBP repeat-containing protein [Terriglobia bacterium]
MIVFMILAAALGFLAPGTTAPVRSVTAKATAVNFSAKILARYPRLPMSFEPNDGQENPQVKFSARGQGYTLFLTSGQAVLALKKSEVRSQESGTRHPGESGDPKGRVDSRLGGNDRAMALAARHMTGASDHRPQTTDSVLRMKLTGANANACVAGISPLAGESNYFIGNDPARWVKHVPNYAQVRYEQVYPGVDQIYYGNQGALETDFVVSPASDPGRIRLNIQGAGKLAVNREGDLVVNVGGGEVRFQRPVAYQEVDGRRQAVGARYELAGKREVKFKLGQYDHRSTLVIDPVLIYSTYLGGSGGDAGYGIAVDSAGEAFVTGTTASNNFPITSAVQTNYAGDGDVFVVKLTAAGTGVLYSTYLGGGGADTGTSIAIDSSGNAYVAGKTTSPDFPVTTGVFQPVYGGEGDGFITKIAPAGSSLVYSSFIGGSASDSVQALAIDSSGSAYLTGSTESSDFPTVTPLQIGNDGCSVVNGSQSCTPDAFVVKVSPSGASKVYSTYLGGSSADNGQGIAVDASGNVYVAGYTFSTDFPTQNAFQSSNRGGADAFITELNATGTELISSTYFGGSGLDRAFGLALDATGNIYIAGDSNSTDFPTANAFQAKNDGQGDAFICKFAPGATSLVFSTFLGGTGTDQATAIALDSSGNAYVTGFTNSSDFLAADPLQRILGIFGASSCGAGACSDAFAAEIRSSGELVYSTYLGGNGTDFGQAVAVDSSGQAYITGATNSLNFPVMARASQGAYAGTASSTNAFIAKINSADAAAVALNPQSINFGNQSLNTPSDPLSVTLINAGSSPLSINTISASGDFSQTNNCGSSVPAGGGNCSIQITFTPATIGNITDQISITDNAAGSPQQITVTGNGVASSLGSLTFTPPSITFPAITVGATSPAQIVRVANTGKASVTLSSISLTGNFAESNTCGSLPNILNVGDGCSISIVFTPTLSGNQSGTLTVTSNAAGAAQTVPLSGTGNAVFSLAANARSSSIQIGTASTTFTVSAAAAASFTGNITLACTSGATCSFNPSTITAGQSSIVTVSGLTASTANPFNFSVTGTNGGQNASVALTIFFSDFAVLGAPPYTSVSAGKSALYTVTVTPSNNFNGVVLLSCGPLPPASACVWTPSAVQLQGAPVTASLSVNTTVQSSFITRRPSGPAPPFIPSMGFKGWVLLLLALSLLAAGFRDQYHRGPSVSARLAQGLRCAALCLVLFLVTGWAGCNDYYNGDNFTPAGNGTTFGNYTIVVTGTLGNNNSVIRTTSMNLTVGP